VNTDQEETPNESYMLRHRMQKKAVRWSPLRSPRDSLRIGIPIPPKAAREATVYRLGRPGNRQTLLLHCLPRRADGAGSQPKLWFAAFHRAAFVAGNPSPASREPLSRYQISRKDGKQKERIIMEYGILVAVSEEGDYQIIGRVDSVEEARNMAWEYIDHGPMSDLMAPDYFVIDRRSTGGWYTKREKLEL
jgi:hypothetical protein